MNGRVRNTVSLLGLPTTTVLAVLETRSFSEAARVLGVRQSTVSRRIRDLEDTLGISIFERTPQGVRVTDAGRQFHGRLIQAKGMLSAAVDEARDAGLARVGRLRWGYVGSFATSPAKNILAEIRAQHPDLKVQLAELGTTELIHKVIGHELDCAWVASWRSPDPALVFEPLWSESLYLAVPAGQPSGDTATWAALSGQVLLARPEAELDLLFPVLEKAGIPPPEVQFHDCSRESLVALVAEGQGVAIVPESFARMGRTGVRFVRVDEPTAKVAVAAMYRRDRDNPALRRLLAIARDWLRVNQASLASPSAPG